jgi:chitodextrinase
MYRHPGKSHSRTLIRLTLCALLLIQSSIAMAAPSRTNPPITRPIGSNRGSNADLPTATTITNQRFNLASGCPKSYCSYLPFMATGGEVSPPVSTEPDTQPTPVPPGPETEPTPTPSEPETQPTPTPTEPGAEPTPTPTEPGTEPTPTPTETEIPPTPIPSIPDTQAPSIPLDLYAIAGTDTSISLAWEAATDDVGVAGYEIFAGTTRVGTATGTRLTIGDLAPTTTYTFTVAAYDAAGNRSGRSDSITVITSDQAPASAIDDRPNPDRPWNVRAIGKTHGTIDLAWDAPTDNPDIVRYDVKAGDLWLGSSETPELNITGLTAATNYQIAVYAVVDAEGHYSEPSNTLNVTTNPPLSPRAIASQVDTTVASDIASNTAFLYTGENPIQTGVQPSTIDPQRVAILRGRVTGRDGMPLAGVHISIVDHPEYGATSSRNDGEFDLAINGGGIGQFSNRTTSGGSNLARLYLATRSRAGAIRPGGLHNRSRRQ